MVKSVILIRSGVLAIFIFTFNILMSQPAIDGFMKGKGNLDLAPGITYETYSNYYGRLNEVTSIKRSSIAFSVFGAMGVTNWLDIQVSAPYVSTKPEFSGLQDFSSFIKISPLNKYFNNGSSFRIILAGGTSFPMSDYETESQFAIGQQATAIDGRLVLQYMKASGFFIMAQGGMTSREDPVPSSYPAAIKIGWAKAERYIDVWYDQQIAIDGNDYLDYRQEIIDNGSTDITFRTLGVSYGKLGVTYYKPIGGSMGYSASASYVLWGRNFGQAIGVSVAFIKRFSFSSN